MAQRFMLGVPDAANDPDMIGWPDDWMDRVERVRQRLDRETRATVAELKGQRIDLPPLDPLTEEQALRIDLAVWADKESGRYTERRDEIAVHGRAMSGKPCVESIAHWRAQKQEARS